MDHYYDIEVNDNGQYLNDMPISLKYITNFDDDKVVDNIEFPEFPELIIQASEYGLDPGISIMEQSQTEVPGSAYGQYSVREIFIHIQNSSEAEDLDNEVITQAQIHFSDSSSLTVDIGKIHLYNRIAEEGALESIQGSASSDGTGETVYRALEEVTISSIGSSLLENVDDRVDIQINDLDYTDAESLTIQEESLLRIITRVSSAEKSRDDYTIFDIHPELTFTTEDGTEYNQRIYNINNLHPEYSFLNLYRYLKARGDM